MTTELDKYLERFDSTGKTQFGAGDSLPVHIRTQPQEQLLLLHYPGILHCGLIINIYIIYYANKMI